MQNDTQNKGAEMNFNELVKAARQDAVKNINTETGRADGRVEITTAAGRFICHYIVFETHQNRKDTFEFQHTTPAGKHFYSFGRAKVKAILG